MRSLNEALLEEHAEDNERTGYIEVGQVLTPFEKYRLEFDPTLPVYLDRQVEAALARATVSWHARQRLRRKDVPVTEEAKWLRNF